MKTIYSIILVSLFLCVAQASETSDNHSVQHETLMLHTDRDLYIAGEYLYYQLSLVPPSAPETPSRIAYLALCGPGNNLIENVIVRVQNNIAFGSIYLPDTLSTGPYSLVCFTSRMRSYYSENHISQPLFIVNRFDETLGKVISRTTEEASSGIRSGINQEKDSEKDGFVIQTDKKEYGRREKVELSIAWDQKERGNISFSISVADNRSILFDGPGGVVSKSRFHHMEGNASNGFLPETMDMILSGRLKDQYGNGLAGERILLSTPDSVLNLQYAYTEANGDFYFRINDYYLGKPLYISADKADTAGSIEVYDKFHFAELVKEQSAAFTAGHPDYIFRTQQHLRLQKLYETEYMVSLNGDKTQEGFRPHVYGAARYTILPQNYTPLRDFREISRELISQVRIRKQRGEYSIRVHDERTAYKFFDAPPAIFLDAIPVNNISEILHLGSEYLQRIEVQNYHWAYGDMRFSGILALFSKKHEYQMLSMPPSSLMLPGFDIPAPSVFTGPDYSKDAEKLNTIPDLRNMLYWHPNLQLQNAESLFLTFYTGDLKGRYVITIEGLDENGKRFSQKSEITVN